MIRKAHIALLAALALATGPVTARAEEVLPALSEEKMSEYKNAFGKAVSDSLAAEARPARPDGRKEGGPAGGPPPGGPKGDPSLSGLTKRARDDFDGKGPPAGGRPQGRAFPGGPPDGNRRPPGIGGPGQPGGPRPGGPGKNPGAVPR